MGNQCSSCLPEDPNHISVGAVTGCSSSEGGGSGQESTFSLLVDTEAMWEPLYALMEKLSEEGILEHWYTRDCKCEVIFLLADVCHVDEAEVLPLPLFDFVPQLPEFVMRRKHSM